ncbi:MAG: M6 family metalloprotease domain-containing protein [Prevotella sp.]|nr:M6 family metalloprotease domain-containing protein [Prevotella sp.]
MIKRTFSIFAATLVCAFVAAVPAKRGQWKLITLEDGTKVKAELRGDEHCHYWQSEDGQCYVVNDTSDRFVRTDINLIAQEGMMRRAMRKSVMSARTARGKKANYFGSKKGLIILTQFQNKTFREENNQALYNRIANELNFNEGSFRGSVRDYFRAQSNGQFDLEFDVIGPVTISENYEYYGKNIGKNDAHPGQMVAEACKAADSLGVDFSQYDWDNDGEVDQVFVLYAGRNEATGGGKNTVWPHEFQLKYSDYGEALTLGTVTVNTYACSSELGISGIDGIGTICHEFTHCLGLPDMYDTNYTGNFGMNEFDLMDAGSYNGNGFVPAGYSSYEKWECGWIDPIVLKKDVTIEGLKPMSEHGDAYVIYNDANKNEYYLLENRQQTGWDEQIPGAGLLIIHVDYDPYVWMYNVVNSKGTYYNAYGVKRTNDHERCTIFHADNSTLRAYGDPYPYKKNDSLTVASKPAATLYNKSTHGDKLMHKAVLDIKRNDDNTMSFTYRNEDILPTAIVDLQNDNAVVTEKRIYSIDGRYMGNNLNALEKGLYIINGKKVMKD